MDVMIRITAMRAFRFIFFVVVVLTNAHSVVVAFGGLPPNVLSVGIHSSKFSCLRMGENDETSNDDDAKKRGDNNNQRRSAKKGDILSASNTRAKMNKAATSSSCSKLLTPPSIVSSSSRQGSNGRRWANNLNGDQKGVKKRTSTRNGRKKIAEDRSIKSEITSKRGKPRPPIKSVQADRQESKLQSDRDGQNRDKTLSIPPFTSAPDEGGPFSPIPIDDSVQDFLPSSSYFSPSETSTPISTDSPYSAIEGVLPVSELFYQSTQSIFSSDIDKNDTEQHLNELHDDEELPFSAEQSDQLTTAGNKIRIRRNEADGSSLRLGDIVSGMSIGMGSRVPSEVVRRELTTMAEQEQEEQRRLKQQPRMARDGDQSGRVPKNLSFGDQTSSNKSSGTTKNTRARGNKSNPRRRGNRRPGRKMVRRGMEMLVGGEPINADPPQRSIELNYYQKHPKLWARAITTNSPDFGPLLHMHSAGKVEKKCIGLFCEHFVQMTQKWHICPDDLNSIASQYEMGRLSPGAVAAFGAADDTTTTLSISEENVEALLNTIPSSGTSSNDTKPPLVETEVDAAGADVGQTIIDSHELDAPKGFGAQRKPRKPRKASLDAPKGFGAQRKSGKPRKASGGGRSGMASDRSSGAVRTVAGDPSQKEIILGGELKFSLGVSRSELDGGNGRAFRRVLRDGIGLSINADEMGFDVHISKLVTSDVEGDMAIVVVRFHLTTKMKMDKGEAEIVAKKVNRRLSMAMDDGKMAMTLARVAREEKGLSARIRNLMAKEFLSEIEGDDEEDDSDADSDDDGGIDEQLDFSSDDAYDGPFGMEGDIIYAKDDIWLGGGNGGVFYDYSKPSGSIYKGKLGPYLVDAAVERARQNQPRVIVIGDVHGCIDEFKALLKKCDYHPGDTIVSLGDLVCKGPDSLSVVQMARELGAIGVRGNHDFEVVRWHQAIKSGADPPVIGSEHYYVASSLSTADLKWMYSLPWFISSSQLNALFVHAGFVSGIRSAKQNPRLMMNMRSILPDGTVTSKFFNNWPWARLWDGPQTVFFGHDADRGLQQYEHAIGLDTGCVYGGKLTACILPERRIVSVNAKREYFQYRRKHFD